MLTDIQDFVLNFSSILWEAMPFIVLGAVVAGVLQELLPQQLIGRVMPRSPVPAVIIGGLLGIIFPVCECGILVVMRRLIKKGFPLSCCISYMLAGPIVNGVVLLSTYKAFGSSAGNGWEMLGLRAGLGFIVACVTGLVVHFYHLKHGDKILSGIATPKKAVTLTVLEEEAAAKEPKKTVLQRLGAISETTLHDFLDITVFLILGATLAALAKMFIQPETLQQLSRDQPYLAIPVMMLLAVVMCLCSEADAFVAASFTEMSVSSKLAFLVLGPMLDFKLLLMYTRVFRPKLIALIVACTVSQTLVYTMIVHAVYDPIPGTIGKSAPNTPVSPAP